MWLELSFVFLAASFPAAAAAASSATLGLRLQMMSHEPTSVARNFTNPAGRHLKQIDGRYDGSSYLLDVAIGTPAKKFTLALSTGGDLIMTQCKPCKKCIPQHGPLFSPRESSSFSPLPCSHELCKRSHASSTNCNNNNNNCDYSYSYFGRMTTEGFLGKESFTFGSGDGAVRVPDLVFGCGVSQRGRLASGSSGTVGLDRGPLSLVSQLDVGRFSHCFAYDTATSPLFFSALAKLDGVGGGEVRSTPLLRSPAHPTLYYLSLEGITVGKTRLPIPRSAFEMKEDGSGGGTIIDSGFADMHLNEKAFEQVSEALRSQMRLPAVDGTDSTGYEICFESPQSPPIDALPELVLHLEGADLDLQVNNYLGHIDGLLCVLAERSIYEWSIIGNRATKDMHVLYDLEKETLSFQPAKCSEL